MINITNTSALQTQKGRPMKLNYLSTNLLTKKNISFPETDTIDICIFSVKNFSYLSKSMNVLSAQEQEKANSFRQEQGRMHFIASRILLRRILSLYLCCPAKELSFQTGPHGKPYLCPHKNNFPKIHFNLSHSGEFVALAFSSASPVGIDIETVRMKLCVETLVRRFFHSDEYSEFLRLDETGQKDFVFRRWTVREAFLKGIGSGLTISPDSFYIQELPSMFCIKKSQKDYSSWRIEPVPVPDSYYCSIAYRIPNSESPHRSVSGINAAYQPPV